MFPIRRFTASALSGLIEELLSVAEENSEKWTRQYLALLSAHPLIEMCHVPGLFGKLAKLSLSKVSVVRNKKKLFQIRIIQLFEGSWQSELLGVSWTESFGYD